MLIGPDPRARAWCAHYHDEDFPILGMRTLEWHAENDAQAGGSDAAEESKTAQHPPA